MNCVKYKIVKNLKTIRENLWSLELSKEFLDWTPEAQSIRAEIKFDLVLASSDCSNKISVSQF
jgi:hypothetical protein